MLRFFTLLLGPVFAKEMVEMARRKRYYFNRAAYGLVLLFTLFVVWSEYRWRFDMGGGASIHATAKMAETMFRAICTVQYIAVYVLVPMFLCGVIASEREEQTLELLFTTQLTDREIVLGKLISREVVFVLLILCAMPVLSFITLFGGVDPEALWMILATTFLALLYAGSHAIYFTAVTKSPMGALVRTYWWMALWLLGLPMMVMFPLAVMMRGTPGPIVGYFFGGLALLDPIIPFTAALTGDSPMWGMITSSVGYYFFPLSFVGPGLWSVFLLWRAVRRVRLAPTPFARWLGSLRLIQGLRRPRDVLLTRRWYRPDRIWHVLPIRNPFWLRARRAKVYDREGYVGRIQWAGWATAAAFAVMFAIFEPRALRSDGFSAAFLVPTWIAIAGFACILSAISLVGDRRRGLFELVLVTPVTGREVIDGTLLAVWEHLRRLYWLPWVTGLFFCLSNASTLTGVMCSTVTGTLFTILLVIYGVGCSICSHTIPGALLPTFVFPLLMNLGIVFFMGVFREASGPALWIAVGFFLIVSRILVRRRITSTTVGCYLMAIHLTLMSIVMCWTGVGHGDSEFPIAAMHPGYMTFTSLSREQQHWFRHSLSWQTMYACYWGALVANIIWARWWLIRQFDVLVERQPLPARRESWFKRVRRKWRGTQKIAANPLLDGSRVAYNNLESPREEFAVDAPKTVEELCAEHQMDYRQLAEKAALEEQRVLAIALGRWTPSPAERDKVAAVFGLTRDQVTWGHKTPIQHIYGSGPA